MRNTPKVIIKSESERLVAGEVYVPLRLDTDNEFMRASEIKKAAHRFMKHSDAKSIDEEHNSVINRRDNVVESYIAKANDPDGFHKDAWVAVTKVKDNARWEKVLKGELNGYSMSGKAIKLPRKIKIKALTKFQSETVPSTAPGVEEHVHKFDIEFDKKGKIIPTRTDTVNGHSHEIHKTTATEMENDHAHRFDVEWTEKGDGVKFEEREDEAKELVEVYPKILSLVEHGAVRRGFRIVKSDYEEINKMDRVVQAIILDKDVDMSNVQKAQGLEWLGSSRVKVQEIYPEEGTQKYVFLPEDDFEAESMQTFSTPVSGAVLHVGMLKSDRTRPEAVVLEKSDRFKPMADAKIGEASSVEDYSIDPAWGPKWKETFDGKVSSEIEALRSALAGLTRQSEATKESVKTQAITAVGNFRAFLEKAFDALPENTNKMEEEDMTKEEVLEIVNGAIVEKVPELMKKEFDTFKSEMTDILKSTLAEDIEEEEVEKDGEAGDEDYEEVAELAEHIDNLTEAVVKIAKAQEAMMESVEVLKADLDKSGRRGSTNASAHEEEEAEEVIKSDEDDLGADLGGNEPSESFWRGKVLGRDIERNPKVRRILGLQ